MPGDDRPGEFFHSFSECVKKLKAADLGGFARIKTKNLFCVHSRSSAARTKFFHNFSATIRQPHPGQFSKPNYTEATAKPRFPFKWLFLD